MNTEQHSREHVFYVSPSGNDSWSGRFPDPQKNDGPFATPQAARNAVRELKRSHGGVLPGSVAVFLREGTCFLPAPLTLTPADSGTSACPICYAAYRDEKPVLSGGRRITAWQNAEVNGRSAWKAVLADVAEGKWFFRELWADGQRRCRARHPQSGYSRVAGKGVPGKEASSFSFHPGDVKRWQDLADAELVIMYYWRESRLPLVATDMEKQTVLLGKQCINTAQFPLAADDLYCVENVYDELNKPGQWFLRRKTGELFYIPETGETPEKTVIIAPALTSALRLEGKPETEEFVEQIIFRGITFAHTEWELPPEISGFNQAAHGVPGCVSATGARACRFERCTVRNAGAYGFELGRGCRGNRIVECEVFDVGAGGIKVGEAIMRERETERTAGNGIEGCHVHDVGRMFSSAVGVWIGQSSENWVRGNHIHDLYYTGISVGWTWGYGPSLARGNVIENNHVHHVGKPAYGAGPVLSDMGGIYTLGVQPGTIIRGNVFHDIEGYKYGGFGIYLDEGSSGILVEKNIAYRTSHAGFHLHFGKDNVIRNNIFAFGRDEQIRRSRDEAHCGFTFQNNIVYWREGLLFTGMMGCRRWLYLSPGVAERGADKAPALFRKFILGQDKHGEKELVCIRRVKGRVKIDGDLKKWQDTEPFKLKDARIAPGDLSADIYLGWDEENLYFAARVMDEMHWNTVPPELMYQEDSITIAVDPLSDAKDDKVGYDADDYEFGFALTAAGPRSWWWTAPLPAEKGLREDVRLAVKRESANTLYEAAVPLRGLGLAPGRVFGMNVVVFDAGPGRGPVFNRNIYYRAGGEVLFCGKSLAEWQRTGQDRESLVADPLFVDAANGDYRLTPGSPALKLGFQPIPFDRIGVRKRL